MLVSFKTSTKSVMRAEQDLPGTEGARREEGAEGGVQGGEMTQTMYAHVNK
jgi:hypothetical protein